ncbi:MAG: hypothetical protein C5B53_02900 [Candidatus Melainabacteria bacterium]|nr:MAG: hypothetical protein C5B53_02900 [Candidatus Melainabacteria bacterium]
MKSLLSKLFRRKAARAPIPEGKTETDDDPCCSKTVHIAYRGISDDRLYLNYDRKWGDVKFFRPNGLRVFCGGCRRRIL